LLGFVLLACSSSSSSPADDPYPDRAAMEAVIVGSWTGTYDAAAGRHLVLKVKSAPAVQPKCGSHVVSTKCITTTDMGLTADATAGTESLTMTGHVTAMGSTAEQASFFLKSSADDLLTCQRGSDRWIECKLHLHGVDYGPFDLVPTTVTG
jgi:hypothetical protein